MKMKTMKIVSVNEKTNKCAHCETPVGKNSIFEESSGNYFCCEGCRSVYYLINKEGFSSFYSKRSDWQTGPVERTEADPEYFEGYLKIGENGLQELVFLISGIRCAACIWLIETSLAKDPRIRSIRVNYANHKAKIIFDPNDIGLNEVLEKVTRLGYCPLPISSAETKADKERRDYFYRFTAAAFFSMQLMIYSAALYAGYFQGMDKDMKFLIQIVSWMLATPVILYSAFPFFTKTVSAMKSKHFTMDTLVALGAGSAYLYSVAAIFTGHETYFDTSSMIITLILLGRFIEAGAKQRGGDAVSKLLSLKPLKVKLLKDKNSDEAVIIPIDGLKAGDYFICSQGEAFAADGKIIRGSCEINESMLTGEPLPVEKYAGDKIFAGTKIVGGYAVVMAENVGESTFLSKIAVSVEDAQSSKAPIQNMADIFIGKFVPAVLLIALGTFAGWFFIGNLSLSESLMRAVSVLVIACPCAMGLATPLAIIASMGKLSEKGIVFKNGEAVERFASANDFYFDKTGTITEGRMTVAEFISFGLTDMDKNMISSVCFYSEHPVSKAIAELNQKLVSICNFKEIPGKGIEAEVEGVEIFIGSLSFIMEKAGNKVLTPQVEKNGEKFASEGFTVTYATTKSDLLGIFGISDTIRLESKEIIEKLIKNGNRVTVLTGDNLGSAKTALARGGIEGVKIYAGVSPFDKAKIIKSAKNPEKTAMIGDGINDAIALTSAGIGIAMRNGTDISMESADAVMLRSDLNLIPESLKICKKTLGIIKENLFWAFSYNIVAIPLAVSGLIHPVMSAAFMSISSLIVVGNSSRIKRL